MIKLNERVLDFKLNNLNKFVISDNINKLIENIEIESYLNENTNIIILNEDVKELAIKFLNFIKNLWEKIKNIFRIIIDWISKIFTSIADKTNFVERNYKFISDDFETKIKVDIDLANTNLITKFFMGARKFSSKTTNLFKLRSNESSLEHLKETMGVDSIDEVVNAKYEERIVYKKDVINYIKGINNSGSFKKFGKMLFTGVSLVFTIINTVYKGTKFLFGGYRSIREARNDTTYLTNITVRYNRAVKEYTKICKQVISAAYDDIKSNIRSIKVKKY